MSPTASSIPRIVVASLIGRTAGTLLVCTLLAGVLVLAPAWYMMEVYDRVVNSRSVTTLGMLSIGVVLLIGALEVLEWHRAETLHEVSRELDRGLAGGVVARAFEQARRQGAQAGQRVLGAMAQLRGFVVSPALTALLDAPVALAFLALLWALHPLLCAIALGAALLQLSAAWWLDRRNADPLRRGGQYASSAHASADRAFEHAPTLQALGMLGPIAQRWAMQQQQANALLLSAARRQAGMQAFSRMLQQAVGSALLGGACWLLLQQSLPGGPGMLIVASLLGGRIVAPLVQLITHGATFVQTRDAWRELCRLMPVENAAAPAMTLPPPTGRVEVEQLTVVPPAPVGSQRAPLLRGLQFKLAAGEILVVLGHSGAGKSTLARALVGLQAPAAGSVRLDGVEASIWPHETLGPHLGYLPQQVALLDGTLADNIGRFGPPDEAMLRQALDDAGLSTFVDGLPEGLQTGIGSDGAWLSGGWRQRVGLARALYGRPAFVVLDEPNASLDLAGNDALEAALTGLRARGCTVVIMSHRSGVLKLADRLLVLRDGQQVAFGPRDEVLAAMQKATTQNTAGVVRMTVPRNQVRKAVVES